MRWHTVGGRLRSTKHSRRLVKKRWRQTRTTDSTELVLARPCWMPDAVPTVMAPAPGASSMDDETTTAAARGAKNRRMDDPIGCEPDAVRSRDARHATFS